MENTTMPEVTPILSADSPLRRLPDRLNQHQRLILDGIRYSIEMADLAYTRLLTALYQISFSANDPKADFPSAFSDVWSVIDAVSRLRGLICALPGASDHSATQAFDSHTDTIRLLRNRVQHMNERAQDVVDLKEPAWGYITWVTIHEVSTDGSPRSGKTHLLASGSMQSVAFTLENPAGKERYQILDLISLRAYGFSAPISKIMDQVRTVARFLEERTREQFAGLPTSLADLYVGLAFTFGASDTAES